MEFGHINHSSFRDTNDVEAIRKVPNLKIEPKRMSGLCQLGKQIRMSYIESRLGSTTRVLELVHMDLMEPMQVESIAGKRYVYVCVWMISPYSFRQNSLGPNQKLLKHLKNYGNDYPRSTSINS